MSDDKPSEATATVERPCTCHPDDGPPVPCARRYALMDCFRSTIEQQARTIESLKVQWANSVAKANTTIAELREQLRCEGINIRAFAKRAEDAGRDVAEQAARLAECERDAGRYRYAAEHLRIGTMRYDSFGECNCEFDDVMETALDAAIDGAKTP